MRSLFCSILLLGACFALTVDDFMPTLEAYIDAFNSKSLEPLAPFLSEDFVYGGFEMPLARKVLAQVVAINPYSVDTVLSVALMRGEGAFVAEVEFVLSVAAVKETVTQAFTVAMEGDTCKLLSLSVRERVVPPPAPQPDVVELSARLLGGVLAVEASVGGRRGYLALHNAAARTTLFSDAADSTAVLRLGKLKLPFDVAERNRCFLDERISGFLGRDVLGGYVVAADGARGRVWLVRELASGEVEDVLDGLGFSGKPVAVVPLAEGYPFPVVMVDLGLGFEAPFAFDLAAPKLIVFPDFFEGMPRELIDEDTVKKILAASGGVYKFERVEAGQVLRAPCVAFVSAEGVFCGARLPEGIAGVVGGGFIDAERFVIKKTEIEIFD